MGQEQLHIVLMRIKDFHWKTIGDRFQELDPINNFIGK
ncbi:hypothetical protein HMPREF1319_1345 [Capnocytophaga ochracea str. Holt 25]|nr:hypothetical protein HMPREF1319_1345 [Capnocytophaga ochracea str. Holt 25]